MCHRWNRYRAVLTTGSALLALCSVAVVCSAEPARKSTRTQGTGWNHKAAENFEVWTTCSVSADETAQLLEDKLAQQRAVWSSGSDSQVWKPRCVVVVHGSLAGYREAIGLARDVSVGMSMYTLDKGKVASRRIDLRSDADGWTTDALPHELTHLVLADTFEARPLPRWVDEGLAVLAESSAKQLRRNEELVRALGARANIPLPELLTLEGPYASSRRDVFYSQSASLAAYLVERAGPEQFREFVRLSTKRGLDAALHNVYAIDGVGHLERLWSSDAPVGLSATRRPVLLADDRQMP